jgi:hypothetical protein
MFDTPNMVVFRINKNVCPTENKRFVKLKTINDKLGG